MLYTLANDISLYHNEKYDGNNAIAIFASRISKHSYTGAKQKTIHDGKGPDTSDRLFNLI